MSKEIERIKQPGTLAVITPTEKLVASRYIEKVQESNPEKVGFTDGLFTWGNLILPVAVPVATSFFINPLVGVLIAAPAAFVFTGVTLMLQSERLKSEIDEVRTKAIDKTVAVPDPAKQSRIQQWTQRNVIDRISNPLIAPLKGASFGDRLKSIFGKRKATVDGSHLNNGMNGFKIEYTYFLMRLIGVKVTYLENEEKVWEDSFKLALDI